MTNEPTEQAGADAVARTYRLVALAVGSLAFFLAVAGVLLIATAGGRPGAGARMVGGAVMLVGALLDVVAILWLLRTAKAR